MKLLLFFLLLLISASNISSSRQHDDHDEQRFIDGIDEDLWEIQIERREAYARPEPQPRRGGGSRGGSRRGSSYRGYRYRSSRSGLIFWGGSSVTKANGCVVVFVAVVVGVLQVFFTL